MVAIPPKYRTFIKTTKGIKAKSIPSPIGFSLVTSKVYVKARTLEYYYLFTGRLIKKENGRYDIVEFDKGALFEVTDSADILLDYRNGNFSFTAVPYDELIPIQSYVSRDSPILGIKVTILKEGSFAIGYSVHHKLADGKCLAEFIKLFCRVSRGEIISESEVIFYTDGDRKPCKPLIGVDPVFVYSNIPIRKRPLPTVPFRGPSKRLVFSLGKQNEIQLKKDILEQVGKHDAKISRFNMFISLIRKAITKARLLNGDASGDLICTVANHHNCEDKNMMKYLGNFVMLIPMSNTIKEVMGKNLFDLALELHERTSKITVPYMESMEHYLNNHENIEEIVDPLFQTHYGAIVVTDCSKFTDFFDFGCGPCLRYRVVLDLSPIPLLVISAGSERELEAVIQLDPSSMDRLLKDREFMKYISLLIRYSYCSKYSSFFFNSISEINMITK